MENVAQRWHMNSFEKHEANENVLVSGELSIQWGKMQVIKDA
jgi:hypothetical protein